MRVRIARKIIKGLVTLLILNASLATNVPVSATSATLLSKQQESETTPARRESAQTVDDRPMSPRLLALSDRLKSGDRTALDNFWKEISERGAPIVEPAAGSDRDVLVTMLWRAKEETRNVFVFASATLIGHTDAEAVAISWIVQRLDPDEELLFEKG